MSIGIVVLILQFSNFADVMIDLGVGILFIIGWMRSKNLKHKKSTLTLLLKLNFSPIISIF